MGTNNFQIDNMIKNLKIKNYEGCFYKDKLTNIKQNKSYIINLENKYDIYGNLNSGSHWVTVITDNDNKAIYFDSFGQAIPEVIKSLLKKYKYGYTNKVIQNIKSDMCGYFCIAFIYFLTKYKKRLKDIYLDTNIFLNLFEDLQKVKSIKNEHIVSMFFKNNNSKILMKHNNMINEKLSNQFMIEKIILKR